MADFASPSGQDQYHTDYHGLPLGGFPGEVVSADFNGDGEDDLAAITSDRYGPTELWWFPYGVAVLLSQPDGSFGPAQFYPTGFEVRSYNTPLPCCPTFQYGEEAPRDLAAADVDGDGASDLVAVNSFTDSVSVLVNTNTHASTNTHGAEVFQPPQHYDISTAGPRNIAVGDFDGKQGVDLALTHSGSVSVLLNDGTGSYEDDTNEDNYTVSATPHDVAAAELDGDNDVDLVLASVASSGDHVEVLLNDGGGGFASSAGTFGVGDEPRSVAAADLDDDGDQDVATVNETSEDVSVLLNDGAANLSGEVDSPYGITDDRGGPTDLVLADLNDDRNTDVAVTQPAGRFVEVLRHDGNLDDGNGSFTPESNSPYDVDGSQPVALTVGDFDGDLIAPDLAAATAASGTITLLYNQQ